MTDLEDRLRAELNRNAERAPGATLLAERIIAASRTQPRPATRRGWPTWTLPLLAAGAVAAIVTGVFVGVSQIRHTAGPGVPALRSHQPSATQHRSSLPSPTPAKTGSTVSSSRTAPPPDNAVGLHNFAATDLTFFGTDDGWALGTANCIRGSGTCPAMVRTTDGGTSWHSMPQPPGGVTGIRFATDQIGYAYSQSVLEMTTNGGHSWSRQSGGAIALETFDGNVVRVVDDGSGCPGPCNVRVEYAPVGGSNWTTARLSASMVIAGDGVTLSRGDSDVYVLVTGHTAGGAENASSKLFASGDDGAHWTNRGEPCQQAVLKEEIDSVAVAASPSGRVALLCRARATGVENLAISTDHGASFAPSGGTIPSFAASLLTGDPSTVLVAAGTHSYRSTNGGASWAPISGVPGTASFVGFESPTLGRIVTNGGRTVWTTTDGGAHWSAFTFPT